MKIQNLFESTQNSWKSYQEESNKLANKWETTGLLEGLGEIEKNTMAMMLENQAKQLITESSVTGTGATFTPGAGEQWAGIALPLVRKIFGQISTKEFVSVQSMNLPVGLIFFLDFKYGTGVKPFATGESVYGTTSGSADATGGLYGAGRFGYSINQFSSSANATASGSATFADVNFESALSASAADGGIKYVTFTTASVSNDLNPVDVRSFVLLSGSYATTSTYLPHLTKIVGGNITFYLTASTAAPPSMSNSVIYYNKKTADNNRGDFEDGSSYSVPNAISASSIAIPEFNVDLRSEAISAKTRKLKAQWTPEFTQDLKAFQNLDAEAELTSMMSEYISLELDLEVLDMLITNAPTVDYWSAVNNSQLNAGGTDFGATLGYYNSQGQWFQTLGTKIQKVSNKIHQKTLRGGANFMVVSPTVSTIIESIPGFASDNSGDVSDMKYSFGVQKSGMFNSRYKVFKNPYLTENVILLGFRGSQFLETGAVYAPYIPLMMTPLVYDPNTFTPRKGLFTRYALKMVRPEFYAKIYVSGLNTI
jgi:hypothetical protein